MSKPVPAGKNRQSAPFSDLRIIGGQFRGRKLQFPAVDGLRPTGDRIRETLFNWLAPEITSARCLDLFAGSGALGFESLSRGAEFVRFIEKNAFAHQALAHNLTRLGANNAVLNLADALQSLAQKPDIPFDIVYLDPPFAADLWQASVELLETNEWLSDTATIYVELPKHHPFVAPANWHLHRNKEAGAISYRLYYRNVRED